MKDNPVHRAEAAAGSAYSGTHRGFYSRSDIIDQIFAPVEQWLAGRPKGPLRVLERGCGNADVGIGFEERLESQKYGVELTLTDYNKVMLKDIEPADNRRILLSKDGMLPKQIAAESQDIFVERHVLHYNEPKVQQRMLGEAFHVLAPGGVYVGATGTHIEQPVVNAMTRFLTETQRLRVPDHPGRFYQTETTYMAWLAQAGFYRMRIAGRYVQPHRSDEFYEKNGLKSVGLTPAQAEKKVKKIVAKISKDEKVRAALNIREEDGHAVVEMPVSIFFAVRAKT